MSYWFYIKIGHVSARTSVPQYPFASKVEAAGFKTMVDFTVSEEFTSSSKAFDLATRTLTSRNVFEEFLIANMWRLSKLGYGLRP